MALAVIVADPATQGIVVPDALTTKIGGCCNEIVEVVVHPALLVNVTVYSPDTKLLKVVGFKTCTELPGFNVYETGKYVAFPFAVIEPSLKPKHDILTPVNEIVGVGSTYIVIVESLVGHPGYVDVTVYVVVDVGDAVTIVPVVGDNVAGGAQLKVKFAFAGVGIADSTLV